MPKPVETPRRAVFNNHSLGGIAVAAIALAALALAQSLDFGSLAEIGPGLFPVALALILLGLSVALIAISYVKHSSETLQMPSRTVLRPVLAILGALVIFALTIKGSSITPALGVTGATPLAVIVAGLASSETRLRELLVFACLLTAICTVLFRFLLSLPLPVAPWLLGY